MKSWAAVLLALPAIAAAAYDSRDPSEAAPLGTMGPVTVEGGSARADGVEVTIDGVRRAGHVAAKFAIQAPPGAHAIELDGPTTGLVARWNGAVLPLERVPDGRACAPTNEALGIDPSTGTHYALAPKPAAACEQKRATVEIDASGRGTLELEHDLTAGFDRVRRRRTYPEVAHLFTKRGDYFVYHFAVRGPGGPTTVKFPEKTDGTWAWDGDTLRIAATEKRRLPVGLSLFVGTSTDAAGIKIAARGTLDFLLPWGDIVAAGIDGDHTFRISGSLGYQLFARWISFFPIGAHFELAGVLDVTQLAPNGLLAVNPRIGLRLGAGGHFAWFSSQLLADLFPDGWRVTLVSGIGF